VLVIPPLPVPTVSRVCQHLILKRQVSTTAGHLSSLLVAGQSENTFENASYIVSPQLESTALIWFTRACTRHNALLVYYPMSSRPSSSVEPFTSSVRVLILSALIVCLFFNTSRQIYLSVEGKCRTPASISYAGSRITPTGMFMLCSCLLTSPAAISCFSYFATLMRPFVKVVAQF